jgi:hypothetical protein
MSQSTPPNREPLIPLEYREPVRDGPKRIVDSPGKLVAFVVGSLVLVFVLASIALLALLSNKSGGPESPRARCSSNLKNIAGACVTYSNTHNGAYPADFANMMASSGMTSSFFICPDSNDTPATGTPAQQAAALTPGGGHLSYVWLGKGVTSDSPTDTVLVYEPLSNHQQKGMNVLFNDYSVRWLSAA